MSCAAGGPYSLRARAGRSAETSRSSESAREGERGTHEWSSVCWITGEVSSSSGPTKSAAGVNWANQQATRLHVESKPKAKRKRDAPTPSSPFSPSSIFSTCRWPSAPARCSTCRPSPSHGRSRQMRRCRTHERYSSASSLATRSPFSSRNRLRCAVVGSYALRARRGGQLGRRGRERD